MLWDVIIQSYDKQCFNPVKVFGIIFLTHLAGRKQPDHFEPPLITILSKITTELVYYLLFRVSTKISVWQFL